MVSIHENDAGQCLPPCFRVPLPGVLALGENADTSAPLLTLAHCCCTQAHLVICKCSRLPFGQSMSSNGIIARVSIGRRRRFSINYLRAWTNAHSGTCNAETKLQAQ
jgi:hypothetical protein